jgi:hypothetical protein
MLLSALVAIIVASVPAAALAQEGPKTTSTVSPETGSGTGKTTVTHDGKDTGYDPKDQGKPVQSGDTVQTGKVEAKVAVTLTNGPTVYVTLGQNSQVKISYQVVHRDLHDVLIVDVAVTKGSVVVDASQASSQANVVTSGKNQAGQPVAQVAIAEDKSGIAGVTVHDDGNVTVAGLGGTIVDKSDKAEKDLSYGAKATHSVKGDTKSGKFKTDGPQTGPGITPTGAFEEISFSGGDGKTPEGDLTGAETGSSGEQASLRERREKEEDGSSPND